MRSDCVLLEPSAAIRQFCSRLLTGYGIEVRVAEDTLDALRAICERSPALVISSVEHPDLPGNSLVAALRESSRHRAIPIVILSGDAPSFGRLASHSPDAVISKDSALEVNLKALLDRIGLTPSPGQRTRAGHRQADLNGRRILLAEDSRVNQLATSRVLHVAGAEVIVVENGRDALLAVESTAFDLILMDIEMPVMDGREALVALRDVGMNLPVLAMTGHDGEEFKAEAESLGFNAVLAKMLSRDELVRVCLEHFAA